MKCLRCNKHLDEITEGGLACDFVCPRCRRVYYRAEIEKWKTALGRGLGCNECGATLSVCPGGYRCDECGAIYGRCLLWNIVTGEGIDEFSFPSFRLGRVLLNALVISLVWWVLGLIFGFPGC